MARFRVTSMFHGNDFPVCCDEACPGPTRQPSGTRHGPLPPSGGYVSGPHLPLVLLSSL